MNGIAIIERTEAGTTTAVIEQEALEFARLNAIAKKRRAEKALQEKKEEVARRKENEAKAQHKAYNRATVKAMLICFAVAAFVVCGCAFDLIHPILAFPIALASLLIGSERLGEWRGKSRNKGGVRNA